MHKKEMVAKLKAMDKERAAITDRLNITHPLSAGWSIRIWTHDADEPDILRVDFSLVAPGEKPYPKVEDAPEDVAAEYLRIVRALKAWSESDGPWPL